MKKVPVEKLIRKKSIDDIVKSLSPEERVLHKNLIKKAYKRETESKENYENAQKNLERLGESLKNLKKNYNILDEQIKILGQATSELVYNISVYQSYKERNEKNSTIQ